MFFYSGIKEIIHQLQLNISRLGPITTCILIDHIQQLVQSGLLLPLYKVPQIKRCLIQFVEHIQAGRFVGIHLQRLIEQINPTKKVSFTNQLNILLQNTKRTISLPMNLACQVQLNTYDYVLTKQSIRNL